MDYILLGRATLEHLSNPIQKGVVVIRAAMVFHSYILCGSNYMCNTFEQAKIQIGRRTKVLNKTEWILCPICGNKTRTMIREDTELRNFPLYCPKCKWEALIETTDLYITVLKGPDAEPTSL